MSEVNNIILGLVSYKVPSNIIFSTQSCQENKNDCLQCHPSGNICIKCLANVFIPNENGGCDPIKKCKIGENYCNICNSDENLCSECEIG